MDEQRKGEIALALARYRLRQKESSNRYHLPGTDFIEEVKRMLEDVARGTQVPKEELIDYSLELLKEEGMIEE